MHKLIGRLYSKSKVIEIESKKGGKPFYKRTFIVECPSGKYNDYIPFECTEDNMSYLDRIETGDQVEVLYELRGRLWNKDGKEIAFLSLQCTGVKSTTYTMSKEDYVAAVDTTKDCGIEPTDDTDLPF